MRFRFGFNDVIGLRIHFGVGLGCLLLGILCLVIGIFGLGFGAFVESWGGTCQGFVLFGNRDSM